ncbi:guanylate kinase [candidate division KSB1 bacterium]
MVPQEIFASIVYTRPTFLVLSGYSGVGKTTVRERIMALNPDSGFSLSITTRKRRAHEQDEVDYIFMDEKTFRRMIERGELLEYENVHGNFYGTPLKPAEEAMKKPGLFIFDVDGCGGISIKKKFPDAILVFLQPPDLDELKSRLLQRHTESSADIDNRLKRIPKETELSRQYEYIVTNEDLDKTLAEIARIIADFQQ